MKEKKKNRVLRFFGYLSLFVLSILVLASIFITFLAYNTSFRQAVISQIINLANTQLTATIEIEDIHLIGFGGIKLDKVKMITGADTLASLDDIFVDLSLEPLLRNKIQVNKIVLNKPDIKLLRRTSDSTWNYDRIAPPSDKEPSKEPTDLTIRIRNLSLRGGSFYMIDSLAPLKPERFFDEAKLRFHDMNLKLNANINLLNNHFTADIKELSVKDKTSGINVEFFKGNADLSPKGIKLKNSLIKVDDFSGILDVEMMNYNVFGQHNDDDLEKAVFDIKLSLENYSNSFAEHFAPIPVKIGAYHNIKLSAKGTLNDLNIYEFETIFDQSTITLNGQLKNLLSHPYYNMQLGGSDIQRNDLLNALPFLDKNTIPQFGYAKIKKLFVEGDTEKVFADMDIESGGGSIVGNAELAFHNKFDYKAELKTSKFNLQKFIPNSNLISLLNSDIKISGSGYDPQNLKAVFDIKLNQSAISDYSIGSLEFKGRINSKDSLVIEKFFAQSIGTTSVEQIEDETFVENNSFVSISGAADISDMSFPKYNFEADVKNLNLKRLLKNRDLPYDFSTSISLQGKGADLDNIEAKLLTKIDELSFDDKVMMPFDITTNISFLENSPKSLVFKSNFVNAEIKGSFTPSELINSIVDQADFFVDFANKEISNHFRNYSDDSLQSKAKIKKIALPKADCEIILDVIDFSPIALFVKDIDISTSLRAKLHIQSDKQNSYISADSIFVKRFIMKKDDLELRTSALNLNAIINISVVDSIADLSYIDISAKTERRILFNDIRIAQPDLDLYFANSIIKYKASAKINKIIDFNANGYVDIASQLVEVAVDSINLAYDDFLKWSNPSQIRLFLKENTIIVDDFNLAGLNNQKLAISGSIENDFAKSLKLAVTNLNTQNIAKFVPIEHRQYIDSLKGIIENFDVVVEGDLINPRIELYSKTSEMLYNNYNIGSLSLDMKNRNGRFIGNAEIFSSRRNKKLLEMKINNLPIFIGIDTNRTMFSESELFDIDLTTSDFPLQVVSPFVPNISKLQGLLESNLKIYGTLPNKINYKGSGEVKNASFLLDNTNIAYTANASVSISNDLVKIDKAILKNIPSDLRDGLAEITGYVKLKDFLPDYIDVSIKSNKLLVLSDASQKPMPNLYGYFVIGTEERPLRFFGTMKEPNLEGDVIVYNAEVKMPEMQNQQMIRTTFTYEVTNKSKIYKLVSHKDTTSQANKKETSETVNFADLINYDLSIRIRNFSVLFDMGALGEVYAKIGTRDPSIPMRYIKYRNVLAPKIYSGELELKEGSTLKIFRIMETKGMISFPTGAIDNPTLELEAKYEGNYIEGSITNYYTVYVYVTGTKEQPHIKLNYLLNGNPPIGDPKKIEEDAFSLILTGKTKSSLGTSSGSTNLASEGFNMGISQLASKSLTDLLLGTGVVQSADVKFQGEGLEKAQVNFSGTIYGVGNWTVGGNISDLSNLEVSFEVPISVSSKAINDIIFQISRSANMSISTQIQEAKDFEMKIKMGGSW